MGDWMAVVCLIDMIMNDNTHISNNWLIDWWWCMNAYIPMTDWYWLIDDGINITVRRMKLIDDGTNNMKLDTNIWLMDVWLIDDGINAINSIIRRIYIRRMKLNDDGIV